MVAMGAVVPHLAFASPRHLTGLKNRKFLDDNLPHCFETAFQRGEPLSVLFVDVDHFKKVNDGYGHQAGDVVLAAVGHILRGAVREVDMAVRYGGEEFLILLPGADTGRAAMVGERIRAAMAGHVHALSPEVSLTVTTSVGVASMASGNFPTAAALVEAADRCVYAAKHGGRNKVVLWDAEAEAPSVAA